MPSFDKGSNFIKSFPVNDSVREIARLPTRQIPFFWILDTNWSPNNKPDNVFDLNIRYSLSPEGSER